MARKDSWTREQLIMALNVHCMIPFKDVKESHPIIQKYAPLILPYKKQHRKPLHI